MNILHLDISKTVQKLVRENTKSSIAEIIGCNSIEKAVKLLKNHTIDLILTGQELEDGTAINFMERIAESEYSKIPVIVLTATDNLEIRKKYFDYGVVDFICKSEFTLNKLGEMIEEVGNQDKLMLSLQNSSIAVVDDSKLSLMVIENILNLHGFKNFDLYDDPLKLLESKKNYDIYLIDMVLPVISGEQLVLQLRRKHPMTVIIVISALEKYNTILHALQSGADDYIIKPFDARFMIVRMKGSYRKLILMRELEESKNQIEKMAVTDELTGISNRRHLFEQLEREFKRSKKKNTPLSVLMIDLDHFKEVNDTFGHPCGDSVLKRTAAQIMEGCRDTDILGRYGGEEFVLIQPNTALDKAAALSEQLRINFEQSTYEDICGDFRITFSGGLCQWQGEDITEFFIKVDRLLYEAKEGGRNNIRY